MTTSATSRRAVLAGIAAAPAIAAPAVAAVSDSDAELNRLGAEFDKLAAET